MAEDKVAFERDCEIRRSDLVRIQNKRIQEFDLLTTTAGLDLIHIVHATEPNSPVETVAPDLSRTAGGISDSQAESTSRSELLQNASYSVTLSTDAFSQPRTTATSDQWSTAKIVPQYVPVVTPKPKSPEKPRPETTYL